MPDYVTCEQCGQLMSARAGSCPQCGAGEEGAGGAPEETKTDQAGEADESENMPFPALVGLAVVATVVSYVGLALFMYAVGMYLTPRLTRYVSVSNPTATPLVFFGYSLLWIVGVAVSNQFGGTTLHDIGEQSPFTRRGLKKQRRLLMGGCLILPLGVVRSLWESVVERVSEE